ncbi:MAG: TIGR00269 family protein [Nitrososphaerales archaeon]
MVTVAANRQKCTRCSRNSVYRRIYSGEHLCGDCFKSSIIEKTRRTISKYDMMKHGDTVAVAVSGGKDSLSLLEVLSRLTPIHGEKIVAITVDEGIKEYRDEAIELSRKMVSKIGLEQEVVSFRSLFGFALDEALGMRSDQRVSACAVCGVLRRRAIDLGAERVGADVVATAHNLDDFLQTYFINLTNGDTGRLEFLNPNFEAQIDIPRRVKPFIEIYEEEIAFYAYLSGIPFQTTPCPYMDEGIRTEIRSFLNNLERRHPGIKYSTFNTALKLTANAQPPQRRSRRCERCGHPSSDSICSTCRTIQLIRNKQI